MDSKGRVQSIDRAVAILKCFSEKRKELKLSEIAEELDLNKSTVHGIISTLKYHGLIDQDESNQKYRLGLNLLALGGIVKNSLTIRDIAKPHIDEVCNLIQETVHLGTLDKMEVVYLDKAESQQSMRIVTTIGTRIPAHSTGIGKIMLAYLDEDYLKENLPETLIQNTPKTINNRKELLDQLELIKAKGYAVDDEEFNIGLFCIAAPVFDNTGKVKYAISVSGPTVRVNKEKTDETIRIVTTAAREISIKLGYMG